MSFDKVSQPYVYLYLQESKEILLKTDSTYIIYPLLFKTESLDIAIILEFWLAKPWWYIGSYTMLSKYGQFMHQFKTRSKLIIFLHGRGNGTQRKLFYM